MKLTIVGICGVLLVPFTGHAANATLLNDTTALFTVDFSFTDDYFEVQVPIMAEYGVDYLDRVDTVGYDFVTTENDLPEIENISGLVLSNETIVGNKYVLPTGSTGKFTLMVLVTFTEEIGEDVQAMITKLPYFLNERRTTVHQNQLDELAMPILEAAE